MNTQNNTNPNPGTEKNTTSATVNDDSNQEKVEVISLPQTDRPEGPFPHSGETAGRTEAEEKEAEETPPA